MSAATYKPYYTRNESIYTTVSYFNLFFKNGKRAYETMLSACLSPYQLLNSLVDFHEIWYGGDGIQCDLDVIILAYFPKMETGL
jgi:hypothetical protein